ncbi:MAG: hypothetical protein GF393_08735, partial [Armatimonadia bacterium]|nr:hypothetical protein [Armatimonadia bacterium]
MAAQLPTRYGGTAAQLVALDFAEQLTGEIERRAALAQALQMREVAFEALDSAMENIAEANRDVEKGFRNQLEGASYIKQGSVYVRKAVIDESLLGGIEEERHRIEGYRYFDAPEFNLGVDLSRDALEGVSAEIVQAKVAKAQENLGRYLSLVFGGNEDTEAAIDTRGVSEEFLSFFETQLAAYDKSPRYNEFSDTEGLFFWHVGYAPVMRDKKPEQVATPGYGETGRIMELFLRNEARLGRGIATLEAAWYEVGLWDDDKDNDGEKDGIIGAPSVRTLTNIATSIVASALAGPLGAAALSLIDDAVFTTADVAGGHADWDDAWGGFGRSAVTSIATAGIGMGADSLGTAVGGFGETFVGKTLLSGTELTAKNTVSGVVDAVQWDGPSFFGDMSWEGKRLRSALVGESALAGYAGGLTTAALEGNLFGFNGRHRDAVSSFAATGGSAVQAGVEYGLTGRTTINVFNFDVFGMKREGRETTRTASGGMLELRLGGDGPLFEAGSGGVDLSAGRLSAAVSGAGTWWDSMRLRSLNTFKGDRVVFDEDYEGTRNLGITMRSSYSFGDANAHNLLERVLSGHTQLHIGMSGGTAETTRGSDGMVVHMATLGERGLSREAYYSRLESGVVFQHEAHRDGVVRDDLNQYYETRDAVVAHTLMAEGLAGEFEGFLDGNQLLEREVEMLQRARESGDWSELNAYVAAGYDRSADYWKLMEDGSLKYDGDGWLKDSNGNYILDGEGDRIGAEGIETGLLNIINGMTSGKRYGSFTDEQIAVAQQIMIDSGMVFTGPENDPRARYWNTGNDRTSITLANDVYAGIYGESLAVHNTLDIYDDLVRAGTMDLTPEYSAAKAAVERTKFWEFGKRSALNSELRRFEESGQMYISYEDYKGNNFIQGAPELRVSNILAGSNISSLFGAVGSNSMYPHRGLDFAIPGGTRVLPILHGENTVLLDGGTDVGLPQGIFQETMTTLEYRFKGESRQDAVFT